MPKLRKDKGAWVISYTYNGSQIRHYPGYASEEKCRLILNAIAADIELGTYDVSRDRYRKQSKVRQKAVRALRPEEALIRYVKESTLKPSTVHIYELATRAVKGISSAEGVGMLDTLRKRNYSVSTIERILTCINTAYKHAGINWTKPTAPKSTATNSNSEAHWLSPSEITAMLAWAESRHNWRRYIQLALETGARPGEILALTDLDYDPLAGMLVLSKNVTEVNGQQVFNDSTKTSNHKGGGSRVFPVNERLKALLPDKPPTGELLLQPFNSKKYFDYRAFKSAFCKAFPGRTPYNFRDTFIFEQLFVHNVSIEVVAVWAGNSAPMIRKSYLNKDQVAMRFTPG